MILLTILIVLAAANLVFFAVNVSDGDSFSLVNLFAFAACVWAIVRHLT